MKKSLLKNIADIFSLTLIYRIIGFVRDMVTASYLGTTMTADAYATAYNVPNLIVELLALGSVSSAALPVFQEERQKGKQNLNKIYTELIISFIVILIVALLLCELFSTQLVKIMAPDYSEEKVALTRNMVVIMLPAILFIGLLGPQRAMLQVFEDFRTDGYSNIIFNSTMVGGAFVAMYLNRVDILMYSFLVAALLQWFVQSRNVKKNGITFIKTIDMTDKKLWSIWILMIPIMLNGICSLIMPVISRAIASGFEDGVVSAVNYSYKMIQLPIGVISGAIVSASYARITKYVNNDFEKLSVVSSSVLNLIIAVTVPIAILFAFLSSPIISIAFERGIFTSEATVITSSLLSGYAPCIVAIAIVNYISSEFYAFKNTKEPIIISAICLVIGTIIAVLSSKAVGSIMIPVGFSVGMIINAVVLAIRINRKHKGLAVISGRVGLFLVVVLGFIAVSYFAMTYYSNHIIDSGFLSKFLYTGFVCGGMMIVYALIIWKTDCLNVRESLHIIREKETV